MGNSKGEGVLKVKILEAKYEAKLEFPWGRGVQNKTPSVGGILYGYLLELHTAKPSADFKSCNHQTAKHHLTK